MKHLLRYIGFGLLYMSVPEYTNMFVINGLTVALAVATGIYAALLAAGYFIQRGIARLITGPWPQVMVTTVFFGFVGLMFEWVFIGHGPGSGAIQLGMFTYWAGLFVMPKILIDQSPIIETYRKKVLKILVIYLLTHLLITTALQISIPDLLPFVIPLLWTAVYTGFFWLYYHYAKRVRKGSY